VHHLGHRPSPTQERRALADPTRRSILQLASTGPASISELARPFGIALPTVLEHVRILKEQDRDCFIGLAAFLAELRSAPPAAAIPACSWLPLGR
jgi:hypothetical protein